ncbi:MAG: RNA polymerase sigma factor [Roseburia sp.]|nr:RNA polymerase sigma factor [Roseburia sp.]
MDIEKSVSEAVIKYSDMLYRICIVILCNEQDVQDAIQDTFCRYLEKGPDFRDEEHEKAWLIRVATNICRDMIRFRIRHPKVPIDEVEKILVAPERRETLKELLELPVRQKTVIYLHYVEGYPVKEIADILGITESAVKSRLLRGRRQMREMLSMEGGYSV